MKLTVNNQNYTLNEVMEEVNGKPTRGWNLINHTVGEIRFFPRGARWRDMNAVVRHLKELDFKKIG